MFHGLLPASFDKLSYIKTVYWVRPRYTARDVAKPIDSVAAFLGDAPNPNWKFDEEIVHGIVYQFTHDEFPLSGLRIYHEPSVALLPRVEDSITWFARRFIHELWDCIRQLLKLIAIVTVGMEFIKASRDGVREIHRREVVIYVRVCSHRRLILCYPSCFCSHWVDCD